MKRSLLLVSLLCMTFHAASAQWTRANVDSSSQAISAPLEVPKVAFANPDTGYIAYSGFVQGDSAKPQVWWDISTDSGYTWTKYAISSGFRCLQLDYRHGWGIAAGHNGDTAAVEWFTADLLNRSTAVFGDYKKITKANIVSKDIAVFGAVTHTGTHVIGQLRRTDEEGLQVVAAKSLPSELKRIDFFTADLGYYLLANSHLLQLKGFLEEEDLLLASSVKDFDFFSQDTGVIVKENKSEGGTELWLAKDAITWELASEFPRAYATFYEDVQMNAPWSVYFCAKHPPHSSSLIFIHHDNKNRKNKDIGPMIDRSWDSHAVRWKIYAINKQHVMLLDNGKRYYVTTNNSNITSMAEPWNLSQQSIQAYPNPSYDELRVTLPQFLKGPVMLELYNSNGQRIYRQRALGKESIIQVNGYARGVYQIRAIGADKAWSKMLLFR